MTGIFFFGGGGGFPCFFSLRGFSLFIQAFFPSFPGIVGGSVGIKNPCFLVVSPAFFQKNKERKDRGGEPEGVRKHLLSKKVFPPF